MSEGHLGTAVLSVHSRVCMRCAAQIWAKSDANLNATGDQPQFTFCSPPHTIGSVTDTLISDKHVTIPPQLSKYSDYINDAFLS
jgi:hypothetical protein